MRAVCVFLVLAIFGALGAKSIVKEETFSNLEKNPGPLVVMFGYRSNTNWKADLKILKKTAKAVSKVLPDITFYKCDGDKPDNQADFAAAQFQNQGKSFFFTSFAPEGIEKYTGPSNVASLTEHVLFFRAPTNDGKSVRHIDSEEDFYTVLDRENNPKPQLLRFWEEWCQHCKRTTNRFHRLSQHFEDRVEFNAVQCSRDTDTKAFCEAQEVSGYPTYFLFTGEEKIKLDGGAESVVTLRKVFDKHLGPAPAPATAPTPAKASAKAPTPATPAGAQGLEARVAALEAQVAALVAQLAK